VGGGGEVKRGWRDGGWLTYFLSFQTIEILAKGTQKCHGADSIVGKYEMDFFKIIIKGMEIICLLIFRSYRYQSASESGKARDNFMSAMKELLEWAGIPEHTYEQILP
jgi:hypothetical protein